MRNSLRNLRVCGNQNSRYFLNFIFPQFILQCAIPLTVALFTYPICFLTLLEVEHTVVTVVVYSHHIIWLRDCKIVHKLVKCEFKLPIICSDFKFLCILSFIYCVFFVLEMKQYILIEYQYLPKPAWLSVNFRHLPTALSVV